MSVPKAKVLLLLLPPWPPGCGPGLRRTPADPPRLDEEWESLERIAIDHAVAEPAAAAGRVAVVRCDVPWDDIGDFHSLAGLLATASAVQDAQDGGGASTGSGEGDTALHTVGTADVVSVDSTGIVASRTDRLVSVIGMDDVVVVDTPDALLVTTRGRAQHVKGVVDTLKASGRTDLT